MDNIGDKMNNVPESITISGEDAITIVAAWRNCNESPGGISFNEAIIQMRDSVWQIALKLREQGYNI